MVQRVTYKIGDEELILETGKLAKQANGSVLVRYDDTVILSTAVASDEKKDTDFFPLTVTFEEKLYSVGKIPGGFLRREGKPSEHATLSARLIDRPIRPLFPKGFYNDVTVIATPLSVDYNIAPEPLAMFASSVALTISDIPFAGPTGSVQVAYIDGKYYGKTNNVITDLAVGTHELKLEKEGIKLTDTEKEKIYLLFAYPKNVQENLTEEQKQSIKALVDAIKKE